MASSNALWSGLFFSLKLHLADRRIETYHFFQLLAVALTLHLLVLLIFIQLSQAYYASSIQLCLASALFALVLTFLQALQHIYNQWIKTDGAVPKRILIIGYNQRAKALYNFFMQNKHYGFSFLGFVKSQHTNPPNHLTLGNYTQLNQLLVNHQVDEIYCCINSDELTKLQPSLRFAEEQLIKTHIVPDIQGVPPTKLQLKTYGNIPIITVQSNPLDSQLNRAFKRLFDILFACLAAIFILSWLIPIIALFIKLDSRGPVFFRQRRHGIHGKVFWCWKFRTMSLTSNHTSVFAQATKDDPRVTRFGKWLRQSSIDEFPQFINVLLGEMSVVGPRPHPVELNENYSDRIIDFMSRHLVKPGITGLAQANNHRGETETVQLMEDRVELDKFYIINWSFWLDIRIVWKTIILMFRGSDRAY